MNILRRYTHICSRWSFSQGLNLVILHRTSWEAWWREGRGSEFADNLAEYQIRPPLPSIKAGGGWGKPLALSLSLLVPSKVRFHSNSQSAHNDSTKQFSLAIALLLVSRCSLVVVEQQ